MAFHPVVDLGSILGVTSLATPIAEQTDLSPVAASAVASTALTLAKIQRISGPSQLSFVPSRLLLLPRDNNQGLHTPDSLHVDYLYKLASSAQAAAEVVACSSILAGQSSEGDDMGDMAFWLGAGNFHENPNRIFDRLGLPSWPESEIKNVAEATLLELFARSSNHNVTDRFVSLLATLKNKRCFLVSAKNTTPTAVYFLVGLIDMGTEPGWGGLIGMGVSPE